MGQREDLDLLTNLDAWQASSHPVLCEMNPDALFYPPFAKRYMSLHNILWESMLRLHGTLEIIKEMKSFAFDELYYSNDMEFWRLTFMNSIEMAIVIFHKLINDSGQEVHSLRSFKNEILRTDWRDPSLKALLKA